MSGQAGKYARFELERRFLVERLPDGIAHDRGWLIVDRYIENTHLRLRRAEPLAGGETIFKLGQKQVPSPPDYWRTTITTIYLSRDEYELLAVLPARELRKRRHALEDGGRTYSVDVFDGHLAGLVLAEVQLGTSGEIDEPWPLPPWVSREVSDDVRFTGGALARLTPNAAARFVSGFSKRP